jgi:hypothetical protein
VYDHTTKDNEQPGQLLIQANSWNNWLKQRSVQENQFVSFTDHKCSDGVSIAESNKNTGNITSEDAVYNQCTSQLKNTE